MTPISQAAWARRHGFSRQYVGRLVKQGVISLVDGRIDPRQADAALDAIRQPAKAPRRKSSNGPRPHNGARTVPQPVAEPVDGSRPAAPVDLPTLLLRTRIKSEAERARLLEIKGKVEAGKYVDADEVRVAAFNQARAVRDALLNLPSRLAPLLAAESDERSCFALLDREVRQALVELTGGPRDD